MRIKKVILKSFKRFHNLSINLGDDPKKIVALVGPNGSGKSSVLDAFEAKSTEVRGSRLGDQSSFFSKKKYSPDLTDDHSILVVFSDPNAALTKTRFLIRSAYRFTSRINVTSLQQKSDVMNDDMRPGSSIDMDSRLQDNYERLFASFIEEVQRSDLSGKELLDKMVKELNDVLTKVLDIKITSLGNIQEANRGKLFFEKGKSKNFPYDNLSSGEKEVIDLVIDLVVKTKFYKDTIFCIDEPELHINTSIQRKLLVEIEKLIPNNCQLWIATHSIGFLRALQEELASNCQVIDFSEANFDQECALSPVIPSRSNWLRMFKTALDDITGLISPKKIIYCEGKVPPTQRGAEDGFDAQIYSKIFEKPFSDLAFVSSGGSTEPEQYAEFAVLVLSKVLRDVTILRLSDRDLLTEAARDSWLAGNSIRRMLKRREIENYLYDFEILSAAFPTIQRSAYDLIVSNIVSDDVKSKFTQLRELCGDNNSGKLDMGLKLASKLVPGTNAYQELSECILS